MASLRRISILALAAAAAFTAAACTTDDPLATAADEGAQVVSDLTYADLSPATTTVAQVPVAPIEDNANAVSFDSGVTEATADATMAAPAADPRLGPGREVFLKIRWGYAPPQAQFDAWVDWSGFIAVEGGTVSLVHTIAFENGGPPRPHRDFVAPQRDPRVLRFVSHTGPASDGLVVRITRPAIRPTAIVIHTQQFTRVLAFEELHQLDVTETLDAARHELALTGRAPHHGNACFDRVGGVTGGWTDVAGHLGAFRGTLTPADGSAAVALMGATFDLRGPYGVFAGKAGDTGLLGGYWAAFHYAPGHGVIVGRVHASDELKGALLGGYRADGDGHAGFQGRVIQRAACPASETDSYDN